MPSVVNVAIHPSQFPENIRRDLLESLRTRRVNHKFHYDSLKQTQKWLALHQACSPSRADADCAGIYDRSFAAAAAQIKTRRVHLIGLGCGGGQKDTRLLKLLKAGGREAFYTPCDVSAAMVLVARKAALAILPGRRCFPFVCDLTAADDLPAVFKNLGPPGATRLITFFGMIPNFEPGTILPKLAALVRRPDLLVFSANLAPGKNYARGMTKILPQYDNRLTRDWLMTFLFDLGVGRNDGQLRFSVDGNAGQLKRVTAMYYFTRARTLEIGNEVFEFHSDDSLRLFFSYRYTPQRVRTILASHGLAVQDQWIARSEEEGEFLCRRAAEA